MKVAVAIAVAAFALLAGSAASSGKHETSAACPRGASKGDSLGQLKVEDPEVFALTGKNRPLRSHNGDHLFIGSAVCTSPRGGVELDFKYRGAKATCVLHQASGLALGTLQKGEIRVTLVEGKLGVNFACDGDRLDVRGAGIRVSSSRDPLFSISGRRGKVVVKVARGFVLVNKTRTAVPARIVGPHEKVVASASAPVTAPTPLPVEQVAGLLRSPVATPVAPSVFARPPAGKSPALRRIFRRSTQTLAVGLDSTAGSARGVRTFVRRFFGLLGDSWHLHAFVRPVAANDAVRLLSQRKLDLFVTPARLRRTQALTFFPDASARAWLLAVSPDPVYFEALSTFLGSALDTGRFAAVYQSAFAKQPTYQPLSSELFPAIHCVPRPQANLTQPYDLTLASTLSPNGPVRPATTVRDTIAVANQGPRDLDCVTVQLQLFGTSLLARLPVPRGCVAAAVDQPATGQRSFRCEVGPLPAGAAKRVVSLLPLASTAQQPAASLQLCASANADESGGDPEANTGNNGGCTQVLDRPPLVVGAAEDLVKQPTLAETKARLDLLRLAGLDAVEVTATWQPGQDEPTRGEAVALANVAEAAGLDGVQVVVALQNAGSGATPATPAQQERFARFAAAVATALPSVQEFVVGNEPNSNRFWLPQFGTDGGDVAAPAYEQLLGRTYDALKEARPDALVIGGALAPRGVDRPGTGRDTQSPTAFLADLGTAYRAGGRDRPIMDAIALHPMPETPTTPPDLQHPPPSTSLGLADYDRLVALLAKAFDGTAQRGSTLPVLYTEYGIETRVPPAKAAEYTGVEPEDVVDERTQAADYERAIQLASCQANVVGLFFFHAIDEAALDRWQSGLYYPDERPKASLRPVAAAAAAARSRPFAGCPPTPTG